METNGNKTILMKLLRIKLFINYHQEAASAAGIGKISIKTTGKKNGIGMQQMCMGIE